MEYHAPALKDIMKIILISAVIVILDAKLAVFQLNSVKPAIKLNSERRAQILVLVLQVTLRIQHHPALYVTSNA